MEEVLRSSLYTICLRINAFYFSTMVIYLCSSMYVKVKTCMTPKKKSLFLVLVDLKKFLGNCSISATPST